MIAAEIDSAFTEAAWRWGALALFNGALATWLVWSEGEPLWLYLEPALVVVMTALLCATRNWIVASIMLGYAVLVAVNLVATSALIFFEADSSAHALHSIEPLHRAMEFSHLYVLGVGVKAFRAARDERSLR